LTLGLAWRRFQRRDPALRARARAHAQALAGLARAQDPGGVSAAFQDCLRAKLGLSGEITPSELARCLTARGAGPGLVLGAREVLEEIQAGVFGVSSRTPREAAERALEIVHEIAASRIHAAASAQQS
jgi:hypothetical protein